MLDTIKSSDIGKKHIRLANLDQLPRGINAPYLECIRGITGGDLIATRWLRKLPKREPQGLTGHVYILMGK